MVKGLLTDKLLELKAGTERLIEAIETEKDEIIDSLFVERQKIINAIDNIKYTKDEFRTIVNSIGLLESFKRLDEVVDCKRKEIKGKINTIKDVQTANKSYFNNSNTLKNIFSTRV